MVCCGLPTQRNNISGVGKVQPHMSCAAEGRLCEVRPIPHGSYSSQPRDLRPAIPLPVFLLFLLLLSHLHESNENINIWIFTPVDLVFANDHFDSESSACIFLSSVSICLLMFVSASVTVITKALSQLACVWVYIFF